MATPKRIGLQVLDSELLGLINASTKIFPITQEMINGNLNPDGYEFGKIQSNDIDYIYSWHTNDLEWVLTGSQVNSISWDNVTFKPTSYTPSTHTHTKSQITDFPTLSTVATSGNYTDLTNKPTIPTDTSQLTKTDIYTKTEVNTALSNKSDATHNHDGRYATPTQLSTKADATHNHDTIYAVKGTETTVEDHETRLSNIENGYTEGHSHTNLTTLTKLTYTGTQTSIDLKAIEDNTTAISGKANTGHTHTKSNITDFAHTHIKTEITDFSHTHTEYQPVGNYATTTELANKVDNTTFTGHTGNTTIHVTQTDKDKIKDNEILMYMGI